MRQPMRNQAEPDTGARFPCPGAGQPLNCAARNAAATRPSGSSGEVSEWLKEHAWKVCKRLNRASGVRIPLSPPVVASPRIQCGFRRKSRAVQDAAWFPWWPRRPLATLGRKSRQGRKAATVSTDAGAEASRRGRHLFISRFPQAFACAGARLGARRDVTWKASSRTKVRVPAESAGERLGSRRARLGQRHALPRFGHGVPARAQGGAVGGAGVVVEHHP